MAHSAPRKRPAGYATYAPTRFSDGEQQNSDDSEDGTADRRDSQWRFPSLPPLKAAEEMPTSCFGHFDRPDLAYTPKRKYQARVVVFHDSAVDGWSNASKLTGAGISTRDFAARANLSDRKRHVMCAQQTESIGSSLEDADGSTDEEALSLQWRGDLSRSSQHDSDAATDVQMRDAEVATDDDGDLEHSSPRSTLMSMRVSRKAKRLPDAEDPYFAGRLAATSVLLMRDGLMTEAKKIGQWGINLVRQHEWVKMVESHGSAPRDKGDDGKWMAWLLAEVDINLRKIDEERAAELRAIVAELQAGGILPQEEDEA